jgi:signal transduction histidine kinase
MARLPELGETSQAQFLRLASALIMPLRRGTELIGFHAAGHRDPRRHFSAIHNRIATGIAQLASVALEHARVRRELEEANRLKSDFVATMSHELRTPLNILIGYGDILREGGYGPLADEQLEVLTRMDRSARQLLELISATLDLSRLDAGRPPLDIAEVDLPALLRDLEQDFGGRDEKPRVELRWEVPTNPPPLRTDRGKLAVILKNLIGNALKFTDEGSVTVRLRPWATGIEFRVEDTGIGIPADAQEVIFDPFRQAEASSTRQHGGVGLGLYVVRRLLDLLGGTIALTSEVGRGAVFTVWLPQDPEDTER